MILFMRLDSAISCDMCGWCRETSTFGKAGGSGKEDSLASMEIMAWNGVTVGRGLSKFGQSTPTVTVVIDVAYSLGHLNTGSPSGGTVCKVMGLWEAEPCWRKYITGDVFEYS